MGGNMKVLKQYPEVLDKKTVFKMTKEESLKLSDCEGQELQVDAFVFYEDTNAKGENVELLAIKSNDNVYATVSKTFIDKFLEIDEMFRDDGYSIIVDGGTSKSGRHYLTCKLG